MLSTSVFSLLYPGIRSQKSHYTKAILEVEIFILYCKLSTFDDCYAIPHEVIISVQVKKIMWKRESFAKPTSCFNTRL